MKISTAGYLSVIFRHVANITLFVKNFFDLGEISEINPSSWSFSILNSQIPSDGLKQNCRKTL